MDRHNNQRSAGFILAKAQHSLVRVAGTVPARALPSLKFERLSPRTAFAPSGLCKHACLSPYFVSGLGLYPCFLLYLPYSSPSPLPPSSSSHDLIFPFLFFPCPLPQSVFPWLRSVPRKEPEPVPLVVSRAEFARLKQSARVRTKAEIEAERRQRAEERRRQAEESEQRKKQMEELEEQRAKRAVRVAHTLHLVCVCLCVVGHFLICFLKLNTLSLTHAHKHTHTHTNTRINIRSLSLSCPPLASNNPPRCPRCMLCLCPSPSPPQISAHV